MKVNGSTISNTFNIVSGVPQGSILGPLLFNVMVNDLLTMFPNLFAYADDTVIYSIAQTETLSHLFSQQPLYLRKFRCGTHPTVLPSMYLRPMPVSSLIKADSYINILGINLDSHLTFKTHAHQVATATNRLIYLFRKVRSYINAQ